MPWIKQFDGDFPTLGYLAADWMEWYLQEPDTSEDRKFQLYQEQIDFLAELYRLDPDTGRRLYHRSVLSRPRGWGKSPFAGALCALEGMGPVLFDGWDAQGQPVGKPWSTVRTPLINIAAVSEDQTANTYTSLLEMLDNDDIHDDYPGLEPLGGFVNLPVGKITPISASGSSIKGARAVFAVMDQTEVWNQRNGGVKLAETMRSNAAKIGGTTMETPNAFIQGEESVAENTYNSISRMETGEAKKQGILWSHREAPGGTVMSDRDSLEYGLRVAYGDSSKHADGCVIHEPACPPGHVDIDRLIDEINDLGKDPQVSRSDFLNQVTHDSNAWMPQYDWLACEDRDAVVQPGDQIVLGFDGSRGRVRGNADATALVAMRLTDRHIFPIRIWEARQGERDWQVPVQEVDREVRKAFEDYKVVGFYADPSGWEPHVATWEAEFGRKLRVKASRNEPIALWPRGKNSSVGQLTEMFYTAVRQNELTHDGSPILLRHVMNARRRRTRSGGYLLYKEFPESPNKIDAAYAAIMAYKAYLDATASGITGTKRKPRTMVMK